MGKAWDATTPAVGIWQEALRVAKPGAHLFAFGGTRTHHRLACSIEDAGWVLKDCLMWLYGTGFPKSLDVSKALDMKGKDRSNVLTVTAWVRDSARRAGISAKQIDEHFGFNGMAGHWMTSGAQPAIPRADLWGGLCAFLKAKPPRAVEAARKRGTPSRESYRKPTGNYRQQAPGATWRRNKDAPRERFDEPATELASSFQGYGTALKPAWEPILLAMKPNQGTYADNARSQGLAGINVDACRIGDEPMPVTKSDGTRKGGNSIFAQTGRDNAGTKPGRWPANVLVDERIAEQLEERSRFFYCTKASKQDQGEGNSHPTVKPVELMRWLVRLCSPPGGGVVLDPFMGSGTTGVACKQEGQTFVGFEREKEYFEIAKRRIQSTRRKSVRS